MLISAIDTWLVEVPVRRDHLLTTHYGTHRETRVVLVRLTTDAGVTGCGEANGSPTWNGETAAGAKHLIDRYLAPALLGTPADVSGALHRMDRAAQGNPFAKSAIEMAVLDVLARAEGVPVFRYLGGPVRDLVLPIRFSLSALPPAEAAALAARRVAWGHRTIKVKVGLDPREDMERVRAVRAAIGPNVTLTVDANGGWSTEDAITCLRKLRPLNLALAEQPVRREDLAGMAAVRRAVDVPIMADESVFTEWEAREALRREACDLISVYPGKNGGITRSRQIADLAAEQGVACAIGSNLEQDPATAAMCHLALCTPNIASDELHGDILGPLYHEASVVRNPVRIEAGFAHCPETPGLGVDLDPDAVRRLERPGC
jgi:L-Ala-D/L-Glu epimerase